MICVKLIVAAWQHGPGPTGSPGQLAMLEPPSAGDPALPTPKALGWHVPDDLFIPVASPAPELKLSPVLVALGSQLAAPVLLVEVSVMFIIVHVPSAKMMSTGPERGGAFRTSRICELLPSPGVWHAGSLSLLESFVSSSSSSVRLPPTPMGAPPFGQPAHASRFRVKIWTHVGMPEPAFATSFMIRSIATRACCWRSATSGSRRNALWPPARRP